jgi:hypothetical protein
MDLLLIVDQVSGGIANQKQVKSAFRSGDCRPRGRRLPTKHSLVQAVIHCLAP